MTSTGSLLIRACSVLCQVGDAIMLYADSTKGGPGRFEYKARTLLEEGRLTIPIT